MPAVVLDGLFDALDLIVLPIMSSQPALPLSSPALRDHAPRGLSNAMSVAGLSINGVFLFVMGLCIIASGFTSLRPEVIGMKVHPYLSIVAIMFPFLVLSRIHLFPLRVLVALLVFTAMYFFSVINGSSIAINEIFKTGSTMVTIVTCALMVRRRGDFVAAVLGMSIAIALLAIRGLQDDTHAGIEAMQGANKNSYSLYALPVMLLAGFIVLRMKTVPMVIKGALIACMLPAVGVIFMGGNRSGYVGVVLIGLMLFWDRRGKGLLLVGVIAATVAFGIKQYGDTKVLDERVRQTVEGNKSDELRKAILVACFHLGLENPLLGVSPQTIHLEIGRRIPVGFRSSAIDSHNFFAHIFAGSGSICFVAMLAIGFTLWNWKPRDGGKLRGKDDPLYEARKLMRMLLVLWIIRGMFTREILYNPCFAIAIGLVIGLCLLAETSRQHVGFVAGETSGTKLPKHEGARPQAIG